MKDFADDSIGSDVDSGKSCDTTISVDADLVAGVSPSGNNLSCNTTSMNIHGTNDVHPSPSLSRLSFEDLKNYKSLKMQKSNYAKQVSINHYSAIQEYLKSDTLDGGMFAPLPYRFKSNAEFMEYVLDSTLPENDKFANPNDPASKKYYAPVCFSVPCRMAQSQRRNGYFHVCDFFGRSHLEDNDNFWDCRIRLALLLASTASWDNYLHEEHVI